MSTKLTAIQTKARDAAIKSQCKGSTTSFSWMKETGNCFSVVSNCLRQKIKEKCPAKIIPVVKQAEIIEEKYEVPYVTLTDDFKIADVDSGSASLNIEEFNQKTLPAPTQPISLNTGSNKTGLLVGAAALAAYLLFRK